MSRAKCKHPPDHVVTKYDCDGLPDPLELSWRECLDCGEWLPLGPSADDDERVRIELRAAEIIANHVSQRGRLGLTGNWEEINGWCDDEYAACDAYPDAYHAGYLARCIAAHDEER